MGKTENVTFSERSKIIIRKLEDIQSKKSNSLLKAIKHKAEIIENNPCYGDKIGKKKLPFIYKIEYQIKNLFRVELPQFWRMLYTIKRKNGDLIIIIDILNHKQYNKLFGYGS